MKYFQLQAWHKELKLARPNKKEWAEMNIQHHFFISLHPIIYYINLLSLFSFFYFLVVQLLYNSIISQKK